MPRRFRTSARSFALAACCLLPWACSLPQDEPTAPAPVQSSAPTPPADPNPTPTPALVAGPAPQASPTPEPTAGPGPAPTPDPGGGSEGAAECGSPLPPPLARVGVKLHLKGSTAWTLDSTPQVGPDAAYCAAIGFPGRDVCPVRPEGSPERGACELYVMGRAVDTGRPGPTWYHDESLCKGLATGCENHPDNQYLLRVFTGGRFRACARSGLCGEIDVSM